MYNTAHELERLKLLLAPYIAAHKADFQVALQRRIDFFTKLGVNPYLVP
jgi:hypothetical protein